MSTPAERVQRFLDNYEGTEIITSVRRLPPGCPCPLPLHLADLRLLASAVAAVLALHEPNEWTWPHSDVKQLTCDECSDPENGVTRFWPCPTVAAVTAGWPDAELLYAALVRQAGDDGERMSLDDIATEFGFTKAELEGE